MVESVSIIIENNNNNYNVISDFKSDNEVEDCFLKNDLMSK